MKWEKRIATILTTLAVFFGACIPVVSAEQHPFDDVESGIWYEDAVKYVWETGLFEGTSEKNFNPDENLSRAMVVTALGRLAEVQVEDYTGNSFVDVPENHWAAPYIQWGHEHGIVMGFEDGSFKPDEPITREQIAKLIGEYALSTSELFLVADDACSEFIDEEEIASWAKEGTDFLRSTGIVKGDQNSAFNPKDTTSRAEAAAIFQRLSISLEPVNDYISLVYTTYDNGENTEEGMTTGIFAYDVDTGRLFLVGMFAYTSQYPLGIFDAADHRAFYTSRTEAGDQICMINTLSREEMQLTGDLWAVNYMIYYRDFLYFVGAVSGAENRVLRLGRIDVKTGEITYWQDDGDTSVQTLYLDRTNGKIYVSAFSYAQQRENLIKQTNDDYENPDGIIYETDLDFGETRTIYKAEKSIVNRLVRFEDTLYFNQIVRTGTSDPIYDDRYSIDLNTLSVSESLLPLGDGDRPAYSADGRGIYLIAHLQPLGRGLYYYDITEGTYTPLVITEGTGFINSMQYVPG